jgi:hypothetical protein
MTPFSVLLLGAVILQAAPALPSAEPSVEPDAGAAPATSAAAPVRPAIPGEPTPDPSLSAGTIVVELHNAEGKPVPRAAIFVESSGPGARGRRLSTETDEAGVVRVRDLPTGESDSIVVGHESAGGVLTSTAPFGMSSQAGARVLLVLPDRTGDLEAVSIGHLHAVLEREGRQLRVTETISLSASPGTIFSNPEGVTIPSPRGASGLRFADAEKMANRARLTDDGVVFTAPIPPGGVELTIAYDVPIEDGRAEVEHEIPLQTEAVQVISTWTQGGAELTVEGFPETETAELRSGLTAQVAAAEGLPGGRLRLKLEGIADGPEALRRTLTLVASTLILALGLGLWIWRRVRRPASSGNEDR